MQLFRAAVYALGVFAIFEVCELCGFTSTPALAQGDCTREEINKARRAAESSARRGDYANANKILDALRDGCYLNPVKEDKDLQPNVDYYWVQSDYSFNLYKLGKYDACRGLLGPILTPRPPSGIQQFGEDVKGLERVTRALEHNEGLCDGGVANRRQSGKYQSNPCPHPGQEGVEISGPALPAGADAGCVKWQPARASAEERRRVIEEGKSASAERLCPKVVIMLRRGGKWQRQLLRADEGTLVDPSDCCNLDQLSIAVINGQTRISVAGGGRDCFGGTAYRNNVTDYAWKGGTLRQVDDSSVAEH
jgi:hypothetical protein